MTEILVGRNRDWRLARIAIIVLFVVSRAVYFAAGIRFNAEPVRKFWQTIDPQLMREDLWRSIWYLHMQPPGYNLGLGLVVHFFPDSYGNVLWGIHLAIGLAIALLLLHLMRLFGVLPWVACLLTALFVASPGTVMFETEAVYEYPIMVLMLLAAVTLFRFIDKDSTGRSLAFFACLLGLQLIRNSFHLIYVAIVCAALFWWMPRARRAVAIGSLLAVVPVLAICVKNQVLFGHFVSSTWAGMNTAVTTTFQLTPAEADDLIAKGVLSPVARIAPFSELKDYYSLIKMPPKTGIPVLDEEMTSTGHANYNHLAYLQLGDMYVKDSKTIWLHYPKYYARSVGIAWFTYFLPASDLHYFDKRLEPIRRWDRIYSAAVFGQFKRPESRKDLRALVAAGRGYLLPLYMGLYILILVPLTTGWAIFQLIYRREAWTRPQLMTLGFMTATIIFMSLISTLLGSFEDNRYRLPLDSFFIVFAGLMMSRFIHPPTGHREAE